MPNVSLKHSFVSLFILFFSPKMKFAFDKSTVCVILFFLPNGIYWCWWAVGRAQKLFTIIFSFSCMNVCNLKEFLRLIQISYFLFNLLYLQSKCGLLKKEKKKNQLSINQPLLIEYKTDAMQMKKTKCQIHQRNFHLITIHCVWIALRFLISSRTICEKMMFAVSNKKKRVLFPFQVWSIDGLA